MQVTPALLLLLTLATCTDAQRPKPGNSAAAPVLEPDVPSFQLASDTMDIDPVLVRPNVGKGPDLVHFDIRVMNFFGASLKKHTVALDMAMSIKWKDPRVIALIPRGLDKMSMSWSHALKKVWMPGVVVTNREIEGYEIIASSVTLYRTGEVLRVERARTNVMKKFALAAYPFDTQHLVVNLASSKYMLDEVVLVPDKKLFGVMEKEFGLYHVKGWHAEVYDDVNGELKKSRGKLDIEVKRLLGKYVDDHLIPTFIVLTISWAVFFFPFAPPFITPRLALSILALLTFTNIMVKSTKELPGPAPFNWNDLFNQQIQTFMFLTIVMNIGTEIMFHQFERESLARKMNHESKIFVPFTSTTNIILVLGSAYWGWMTLFWATVLTKVMSCVLVACYVHYICTHWSTAVKGKAASIVLAGATLVVGGEAVEEGDDADADCGCDA